MCECLREGMKYIETHVKADECLSQSIDGWIGVKAANNNDNLLLA